MKKVLILTALFAFFAVPGFALEADDTISVTVQVAEFVSIDLTSSTLTSSDGNAVIDTDSDTVDYDIDYNWVANVPATIVFTSDVDTVVDADLVGTFSSNSVPVGPTPGSDSAVTVFSVALVSGANMGDIAPNTNTGNVTVTGTITKN